MWLRVRAAPVSRVRSLALFVAVEVVLVFWIRDSLILNVLTLIYPVE
ncbi:MAG: hypothetical protein AVDCRST_MAG12-2170 [uncultured Rubrobacteraceae bacterium]|uniref:Uncharacterized protein n=1 Tax=uncultured Rubrobacteraceae bacterium TaxID=349277 RepID=A0A6J4S8U7_9ACTN|nr:MAG: hypothetical protein AVDCRST_MAG12-2170 [uncultured Rubrobacteraceae bacterium]